MNAAKPRRLRDALQKDKNRNIRYGKEKFDSKKNTHFV